MDQRPLARRMKKGGGPWDISVTGGKCVAFPSLGLTPRILRTAYRYFWACTGYRNAASYWLSHVLDDGCHRDYMSPLCKECSRERSLQCTIALWSLTVIVVLCLQCLVITDNDRCAVFTVPLVTRQTQRRQWRRWRLTLRPPVASEPVQWRNAPAPFDSPRFSLVHHSW